MSPATLTRLLREKASALGFDLFGVVPVSRSETIEIYRAWLKKGYAGTMEYLERHSELKEDPRNLLPQTLSLVALGYSYNTGYPSPETYAPSRARISRYASGDDYPEKVMKLSYIKCLWGSTSKRRYVIQFYKKR